MQDMTKVACITCRKMKSLEHDFYKTANTKTGTGRRRTCKECVKNRERERHATVPKEIQSERRYWHRAKSTYGITKQEFDTLLEAQGGVCASCKEPVDISRGTRTGPRPLTKAHIDHDHTTGHVRGILCGRCNLGIGVFNDNIEAMQMAIAYLELHRRKPRELRTVRKKQVPSGIKRRS